MAGKSPIALSTTRARRIWLRAQRLEQKAPFGSVRGDAGRGRSISAMCRSTPSTWSSAAITRFSTPAFRTTGASICVRRSRSTRSVFEYWTHALSYVPTADIRFFTRDEARRGSVGGSRP